MPDKPRTPQSNLINRGFHGQLLSVSQEARKIAYKRGMIWMPDIFKMWKRQRKLRQVGGGW